MKNLLFVFCISLLFFTSCKNDSYNEKTIAEATNTLSTNISILEARKQEGGTWQNFVPAEIKDKSKLENCLAAFEFFYNTLATSSIELNNSEQTFFEDLEYIERELGTTWKYNIPKIKNGDDEEMKLARIAKTLQNLRKENYLDDIFMLNNLEGKDSVESIYIIKKSIESLVRISCEANTLIGSTQEENFNESFAQWLAKCTKKVNWKLKDKYKAYADSLGYADPHNINYSEAKLICDLQLLNMKMREMVYAELFFCESMNANVNIKLLQRKD
jgi:hypothetical protein